ncbi:hypothetical protein O9K51_07142 [Purpureocillium lavendulum]|uniref:Polyketide synthase n=1 Tax=Purpureocillium lavendulum TaxID=1247861 RepID=A0AB34FJL6_9HYPO|nr:hypothetical protein O9K51_07142 [Purpureocillium lavendulum]
MSLKAFNDTDDATTLGHCLHSLVEDRAANCPTNLALTCADSSLTFEELNTAANHLARALISQGVVRNDLVGVALDRSVGLVVTLLAVLKTGAAYVPIDPGFPAERISHMLSDATPKIIVVSTGTARLLKPWSHICFSVDEEQHQWLASPTQHSNLELEVQSNDLAYVIYTSGSTGKPKGVEISHGALCNLLLSMQKILQCTSEDRLLAVTTVTFDIAALELFLPLICGATTVIAEAQQVKDISALRGMLKSQGITMMQATPASWQMLLDSGWQGHPSLGKILCGGEAMSEQLGARLLECGGTVWNLYGPTEATVWASVWRVRPAEHVIIGKPLANYQLYVLDESLAPVPPGVSGDLYIGGAGLARGYHNKPELTRVSFLDSEREDFKGRIYRTGDIACFSADGKLSVLGRADNQVKVRGYRIELGDVEAAIASHPAIRGAVVVGRKDQLLAYCIRCDSRNDVTSLNQEKASGTGVALDAMLRPWLARCLPPYMMPAFFVELEAFPLTPNNKIDRKALPSPFSEQKLGTSPNSSFETVTGSVAELERRIMAIWARALDHESISTKDNFFQVGGNSIRIVQVQAELEKLLCRPISTAKLFEYYTIETLAAYLVGGDRNSLVQVPSKGQGPAATAIEADGIAIISLACRLPGDVTTPEEFWTLLDAGGDAITDVPKDRWDAAELYDSDPDACGKTYCSQGGYLSSIDSFDISFFGISPREAKDMDPVQLLVLEICWEGLERAGYPLEKLRGSRTGVYIGVSNMPAHQSYGRPLEDLNGYTATGSSGATLSGRVSYVLGLEGPSMTVDTACSSSLVTTDLACAALRRGECDLAVSCGVTLMLTPGLHVEFARLRGISQDGRCRAFSDDTNGTGWAEGSAAVVLRRLSDAQHDGQAIRAVVRGSAVNHGGRSASLTTPSGTAQQRLIRDALASSRLEPGDVDYIEAHGTGTKLGDPIEGEALAAVFRGSRSVADMGPLWVGSAKSNIGHTQAAAGLVGVLKVVLALEHELIPRTLHISEPTTAVDWRGSGMALVQQERPWPRDKHRLRRAGISSFGIGGTNAHVVIEEAPLGSNSLTSAGASDTAMPPLGSLPFLISGHTERALRQQVDKLWYFLGDDSIDQSHLGHLAYSLATTRTQFRHRLVLMAESKAALRDQLAAAAMRQGVSSVGIGTAASQPRLAMLFTGQGSQLPGMGRDLSQVYPVFRESLETTAAHFTLERPLLDIMWAEADNPDDVALLNRTDFAQAALFTLEVALSHLWQSWGVKPHVVLGHSLGEFVAAYAAGILDLSGACRLVEARGRLMQALPRGGGMVSVEANAAEVAAMIDELGFSGMVDIASHNTPTQTVISGDIEITERMAAHVAGSGRKAKSLTVSHAFHSHHMDSMLAEFRSVAETIQFYPPRIAIVSSVTGRLAQPGQLETPHYWVEQVRRPVRFSDAMGAIFDMDIAIFLELGPQPVLSGLGAACLGVRENRPCVWLPSLQGHKSGTLSIQGSVGALHTLHVPVDWASYFQPFGYMRVELPTYAFQRERVLSLARGLPQDFQPDVTVAASLKCQGNVTPPVGGNNVLRISLRNAAWDRHEVIIQSVVREVAADTLGLSSTDEVDVDRTWQENGIDSVMEPQMRSKLAAATEVPLMLPMNITSEYPTPRAFSEYLLHLLRRESVDSGSPETRSSHSDSPAQGSALSSDTEPSQPGDLEDCMTFDNTIQNPGAPKSVFLTSGTDFVGAFLLQGLLELGITVHCLVHAKNTGEAMDDLEEALERYCLWRPQYKSFVTPVVGDLTQSKFGLNADAFGHLANNVNAICHVNGLTGYSRRPLDDCIDPNMVSIREVLRLASHGNSKSLHFILTSASAPEHFDPDTDQDDRQQSCATSKAIVERMVAEARLRGAKASVYRLPLIFASSDTGIYEPGIKDVLHCLIIGSLETGRYPSLDADVSSVMPVDYLCRSIADIIVQQPQFIGYDVGFQNPQALRFNDFFSLMATAGEGETILPLVEWRQLVMARAVSHPTGRVTHVADVLCRFSDGAILAIVKGTEVEREPISGDNRLWGNVLHPPPVIDGNYVSKYLARVGTENRPASNAERKELGMSASSLSVDHSSRSTLDKYPKALSPPRRILAPSLNFYPPDSPPNLYQSALRFFASIPWCSRLIQDCSPTCHPIPGHGQAITFIPQCFNPASARQEQFIGDTLSHGYGRTDVTTAGGISGTLGSKQPPLRHMLSLFRPCDDSHLKDPERPILRVATLFAFGAGTSGYEGILHGGLIATLLDESLAIVNELNSALGKIGSVFTTVSVTASLNIRFLAPVPVTEEAVCVTTWIDNVQGRKTIMKGEMTDAKGGKLVTVESVWVAVGAGN